MNQFALTAVTWIAGFMAVFASVVPAVFFFKELSDSVSEEGRKILRHPLLLLFVAIGSGYAATQSFRITVSTIVICSILAAMLMDSHIQLHHYVDYNWSADMHAFQSTAKERIHAWVTGLLRFLALEADDDEPKDSAPDVAETCE